MYKWSVSLSCVRGLLFLRLWFIMMCLDCEKNSVVHLSLKLIQNGVELLLFGWKKAAS